MKNIALLCASLFLFTACEKAEETWDMTVEKSKTTIEKGKETVTDLKDTAEEVQKNINDKIEQVDSVLGEIGEARDAVDTLFNGEEEVSSETKITTEEAPAE